MPQTELETALANAYPQDLEKLAVDLLSERGYDVDPTGTTGADGGLDARLADREHVGALHVSRTTSDRLRGKLTTDAKKVASHEQPYDFFVFVTTADPQGAFRRRLETDLQETHGWKTDIWAREQLRNALMTDHQQLAREHLGVDPGTRLDDQQEEIETLRDDRLDRIATRDTLPNPLPDGPALAVHVIPNGVFSADYVAHPDDLPSPPMFGRSQPAGFPNSLGDGLVAYNSRWRQEHPDYVYLDEAGWIEAVSTEYFRSYSDEAGGVIDFDMDRAVYMTVEGALQCLATLGVKPPVFVSVALVDVANYTFETGNRLHFTPRPVGSRYAPDPTTLKEIDPAAFKPSALRSLLDRFWYEAGRSKGSPHFSNS